MSKNTFEVTIDAKMILAAYDVPKSNKKELSYRPILDAVSVKVDKDGRWELAATDSYKLVIVNAGYVGGKNAAYQFTVPSEAIADFKAKETLTFALSDKYEVTRFANGRAVTSEFNPVDGTYPLYENLIPSDLKSGCYRYSNSINAKHLSVVCNVVEKICGKDTLIEWTSCEGELLKPVVGIAKRDYITVTVIVMPVKNDTSSFGKSAPQSVNDKELKKLREEIKQLEANKEMFKEMCDSRDKIIAELEARLKASESKDEHPEVNPEVKDATPDVVGIDVTPLTSLKGEHVCITGSLPGMTREMAFDRLKQHGGIPSRNFTKKTTVFVTGDERRTNKRIACEKAIASGHQAVRIVSAAEFVEALKAEPKKKGNKMENVDTKKLETPKGKKPKANAPEPKPEPKPEVVEAVTVATLESVKAWASERGLEAGKNPKKPNSSTVFIHGIKWNDKALQAELKATFASVGYGWSKDNKAWWVTTTKA